ncbi:NUDIX domain-containing protein [Microvirga pudoricolor]|uniref:NUDIX domain-containing protein n=1 Tax=Microvirga pudoricolor TaxID=2778729 RepID=UPI00194DB6F7|nr:NUDIX hydrolase [Microvirga pudoricolor]MBM6596101.1 NUDIX hydrolase [Microvirga pudoricolor]
MTQDITATSSHVVYENRWMRVREDGIRRRDGSTGIYGVVEKADFAVIMPVEDGFTWLVEQYRYPVEGRYWELPQGSWEGAPGKDPLDLARAELLEETGLAAREMVHVGHLFECYGYSTQGYDIFLARGLELGAAQREASEQDMVCRRFALTEVEDMIRNGTIKDATTVAAFAMLRLKGLI